MRELRLIARWATCCTSPATRCPCMLALRWSASASSSVRFISSRMEAASAPSTRNVSGRGREPNESLASAAASSSSSSSSSSSCGGQNNQTALLPDNQSLPTREQPMRPTITTQASSTTNALMNKLSCRNCCWRCRAASARCWDAWKVHQPNRSLSCTGVNVGRALTPSQNTANATRVPACRSEPPRVTVATGWP